MFPMVVGEMIAMIGCGEFSQRSIGGMDLVLGRFGWGMVMERRCLWEGGGRLSGGFGRGGRLSRTRPNLGWQR